MFLTMVLILAAMQPGQPSGSTSLFDGESLAGWTSIGSKPGNWRAEAGLLVCRGDGKGWLSTNRAFEDFELSLEYKIGPGGNSGVLIRAPHQGDPSFDGMEIQILDDDAPVYKSLKPDQYTGSVYGVLAAKRGHTRPTGEWNALKVRAEGSRVLVELNGTIIVDGDVATHPEVLPRHGGIQRKSGFIGLQSHSSAVEYRKITINEIGRTSFSDGVGPVANLAGLPVGSPPEPGKALPPRRAWSHSDRPGPREIRDEIARRRPPGRRPARSSPPD